MAGAPRKEPGHGPTFTLAAHDSADQPPAHPASGALRTASGAPVPDPHAAAPSPRRGPATRPGPHGADPARCRAAHAHLDRSVPPGDVCGTLLPDHGWVFRAVLWGVHPSVIGSSVDGFRPALRRLCSISRISSTTPMACPRPGTATTTRPPGTTPTRATSSSTVSWSPSAVWP